MIWTPRPSLLEIRSYKWRWSFFHLHSSKQTVTPALTSASSHFQIKYFVWNNVLRWKFNMQIIYYRCNTEKYTVVMFWYWIYLSTHPSIPNRFICCILQSFLRTHNRSPIVFFPCHKSNWYSKWQSFDPEVTGVKQREQRELASVRVILSMHLADGVCSYFVLKFAVWTINSALLRLTGLEQCRVLIAQLRPCPKRT